MLAILRTDNLTSLAGSCMLGTVLAFLQLALCTLILPHEAASQPLAWASAAAVFCGFTALPAGRYVREIAGFIR